jgi:3-methyladenine DNA glycosylase/8-oxoguanine DNA glycosylase
VTLKSETNAVAVTVQLGERWRPYRSLAVSYLFASEFEKGT